jgi:hypothetical protein
LVEVVDDVADILDSDREADQLRANSREGHRPDYTDAGKEGKGFRRFVWGTETATWAKTPRRVLELSPGGVEIHHFDVIYASRNSYHRYVPGRIGLFARKKD